MAITIYLLKKTITVENKVAQDQPNNELNKNIFKIVNHLLTAEAEQTIPKYMILMILM